MKVPIPESYQGLPVLSAAAMRELDRRAAEKGLATGTLMERAGAAVAEEALRFLGEQGVEPAAAVVVVCCGRGANGGDGLVAARRLREAGAQVSAFLCPPKRVGPRLEGYPEAVAANVDRARAAGVAIAEAGSDEGLDAALARSHAVVDALLGTGATGKPAGPIRAMIQSVTRSKKPVLAVDIPSGIDPDTGYHSGVFVTARETYALGFPKRGLLAAHAKQYVGTLKILDIGYPKDAYARKK